MAFRRNRPQRPVAIDDALASLAGVVERARIAAPPAILAVIHQVVETFRVLGTLTGDGTQHDG